MQTLPQSALEFRVANLSQTGIYANNEVIGLIQTHPELGPGRWEYCSYSNWENSFIGTYEECKVLAESEYLAPIPPQVSETPLLIHVSSVAEMTQAIKADESCCDRNCIIWLTGRDAPVYWSERLNLMFGLRA